jgi:hypothetical protein
MMLPLDPEQDLNADKFMIQMYDFDLLTANDFIGGAVFDLTLHNILKKCYHRKKSVKLKL